MKAYRKRLIPAAVLSVAVLAAGGAFAESNGPNDTEDQTDIQLMSNARLSLTDAIQAAEKAKNAKAVSAAIEGNNGQPVYEVELMSADGKPVMVAVDGATGQLVQAPTGGQDEENGNGDNGNEEGEND